MTTFGFIAAFLLLSPFDDDDKLGLVTSGSILNFFPLESNGVIGSSVKRLDFERTLPLYISVVVVVVVLLANRGGDCVRVGEFEVCGRMDRCDGASPPPLRECDIPEDDNDVIVEGGGSAVVVIVERTRGVDDKLRKVPLVVVPPCCVELASDSPVNDDGAIEPE